MSILFSKEAHIHKVMFVSPPGANFDALFVIHIPEDSKTGLKRLTYRFRYNAEKEGEEDRRNWYALEETPDGPKDLEEVAAMIAMSASMFFGKPFHEIADVVDLNCDGEEAVKHLLDRPWFNIVPNAKVPGGAQ